jgi:probable selenium-dependent hydroxylase accessory protein YqeC
MKVRDALGLDDENTGIVISFVGGGGKTSSIFTLANELAGDGRKVLITTTTFMYNPDGIDDPNIDILGSYVTGEGKLKGISKERIDNILKEKIYDFILVEADGSKRMPIKAPAGHEPAVPSSTAIMLGVIGIDCYGKAIDRTCVHRPEIFADLIGASKGETIEDSAILSLVSAPNGLYKNCPKGARKVFLINKVLDADTEIIARRIGDIVLERCKEIDSVLIGAVQEQNPIKALLKGANL